MPSFPSIPRFLAAAACCLAALLFAAPAARAAAGDSTAPPPGALAPSPPPAAAEKDTPGFFKDDGAARSLSVAEERGIDVDTKAIRAEQSKVLREQDEGADEDLVSAENRYTETMDQWHDRIFRWLDNTTRTLDLKFSSADVAYEHELSSFALGLLLRAGGRGDDGDFDFKVRAGADLALPGLEKRLHLIADNLGRDDLPGLDPMAREDDMRVGLSSTWDSIFGERWALGGGLRWRSSGPVGYVDLDWRWSAPLGPGTLRFTPRVVWYSDDGFGQNASLVWTTPRDKKAVLQLVSAETGKESQSGYHLEETVRLAFPLREKGCGWILQASAFPHIRDERRTFVDNWRLSATWCSAFYRKWIYYTVTPQVDFAVEDDHAPKPSICLGLDILFGGETDPLL